MESIEDSNCQATSSSFSTYERYLSSFNVIDGYLSDSYREPSEVISSSSGSDYESSHSAGHIVFSSCSKSNQEAVADTSKQLDVKTFMSRMLEKDLTSENIILDEKIDSPCVSLSASLQENSSAVIDSSVNDKSDFQEVPVTSEDTQFSFKQPVFITSTMENSNNAVDSVPMFCAVRHSEGVFKLPNHLSFNGTIKHVKKLQPIVDPITALSSGAVLESTSDDMLDNNHSSDNFTRDNILNFKMNNQVNNLTNDQSGEAAVAVLDIGNESTGDSQYEESSNNKCNILTFENKTSSESTTKWNLDHSYSSLETSFDSGVRSPDMFSDEENLIPTPKPIWGFLKDYEAYDKRKVKKTEEILQGVLPPPSVTVLKLNVTDMLKRYYAFKSTSEEVQFDKSEEQTMTPTKKVSFIDVPTDIQLHDNLQELSESISNKCNVVCQSEAKNKINTSSTDNTKSNELDTSANDKSIDIRMCTEVEAKETLWPDVLKCRYYDVYYNATNYSEKLELLALRLADRYVGAETDTSVCVHSGGMQSPSSATKRKAIQLKMAQAKSPGRRLSHLARRRQTFCRASTISDKAQSSNTKMVLIDKNFFPHKKLISSSDRKSPRRRTPNKKAPTYRTPGKKTPAKTPKTKSGGSSRKKAMRRLLMDPDNLTRSQPAQPTRETLKRALFVSPENRKAVPVAATTSVPVQAMKSRRALFGSPVSTTETKSLDGTKSDHFLKRRRDTLDDTPESSRSKIAKSLSFGGDSIFSSQPIINRRASEILSTKNSVELNETHKKKLLWAVSEALRIHGWRMSSPGFREKASTLARLTKRLLTLPPHAARLAQPKLSTSETMLKLARQYVFAIIQGRTIEDCFEEEQRKIFNETSNKISGYISYNDYQQMKSKQTSTVTSGSQIKENTCSNITSIKQEQPRSGTKTVLQDKFVNVDTNSNSSLGVSSLSKVGIYKSNSMPSFQDQAKMRARRQISFDNVDFPKR